MRNKSWHASNFAGCSEGYHDQPRRFMTSPRRKIEPATAMRGDSAPCRSRARRRATARRAAAIVGFTSRATRARSSGSADRGFEDRVSTSACTSGISARSMFATSLSRIAVNTSTRGGPPSARRNAASAAAPSGLCAASSSTSRPSGKRRRSSRPGHLHRRQAAAHGFRRHRRGRCRRALRGSARRPARCRSGALPRGRDRSVRSRAAAFGRGCDDRRLRRVPRRSRRSRQRRRCTGRRARARRSR